MPTAYHVPAGVLLLVAGLLACFAGYRLLRFVLVVWGFVVGALLASTLFVPGDPTAKILAFLLGGLIGALVFSVGYIAGVMVIGAWVGFVVSHTAWGQIAGHAPGMVIVALFAVAGAIVAAVSQRYIVIVVTAFGGAQAAVAGGLALWASPQASRLVGAGGGWVGLPGAPQLGRRWPFLAWLVLGLLGVIVQLRGGSRRSKK